MDDSSPPTCPVDGAEHSTCRGSGFGEFPLVDEHHDETDEPEILVRIVEEYDEEYWPHAEMHASKRPSHRVKYIAGQLVPLSEARQTDAVWEHL